METHHKSQGEYMSHWVRSDDLEEYQDDGLLGRTWCLHLQYGRDRYADPSETLVLLFQTKQRNVPVDGAFDVLLILLKDAEIKP
jgi:hypothetical protein